MDVTPLIHQEGASSVRSFAYIEETNYCYRPQMEDGYSIMDRFGNDASQGLYAIFDGHGGNATVNYSKNRIQPEMLKVMA